MGYNFLYQHIKSFTSLCKVLKCLLFPLPTLLNGLLFPPPIYWKFYCFLHQNIELFITPSTSTLNSLLFPSPKYWIIYYLSHRCFFHYHTEWFIISSTDAWNVSPPKIWMLSSFFQPGFVWFIISSNNILNCLLFHLLSSWRFYNFFHQ